MKIILAFIFACSNTWAKTPSRYNYSQENVIIDSPIPGKFSLATNDYQDIRIDSNLDGKVDFWYLKSRDLEIKTHFKSGKVSHVVLKKHISNQAFKEVILRVNKRSNLYIAKSEVKKFPIYNGAIEDACVTHTDSLKKQAAKLSDNISTPALGKTLESYIDESCFENTDFGFDIQKALEQVFKDGISSTKESFPMCIDNLKDEKEVRSSNDARTAISFLSAKLSLDFKTIANNSLKEGPKLFTCKIEANSKVLQGAYQENTGITLKIPTSFEDFINITGNNAKRVDSLKKIIRHEILHKAGVKDEVLVEKISAECPKDIDKDQQSKTMAKASSAMTTKSIFGITDANVESSNDKNSNMGANTKEPSVAKSETSKTTPTRVPASQTGGGSEGIDMKNEIAKAEAVIPSSERLAQTKVDKSPEGIQTAVKESLAESAPVLRVANQVMGVSNTPALASSSKGGSGSKVAEVSQADSSSSSYYEPSSSASSSNSGETSSSRRYQRTSRYESSREIVASNEGPKVITSNSSSGLAAGERIVEEIDLSKGTNFKSTSASTSKTTSTNRNVAATRAPTDSVPAAPTNFGGEAAAPGPISAGSTGLGPGTLQGSSTGNSQSTTNRRASGNRAPASSATSQNSSVSSREEIVTFLSSGTYSSTKNKLRDSNFVNTLRTNKVTVIDLYGNSFGAIKGDVIFLDEGSRFIRQK